MSSSSQPPPPPGPGGPPRSVHSTNASRLRPKARLSCTSCRALKLKCDRMYPCRNCLLKDKQCEYAAPAGDEDVTEPGDPGVQDRLAHLEGLVRSMIPQQAASAASSSAADASGSTSAPAPAAASATSAPATSAPVEPFAAPTAVMAPAAPKTTPTNPRKRPRDRSSSGTPEAGSMRISATEHRYVGGDHWMAIVDGIADLRNHLLRDEMAEADDSDPFSGEPGDNTGDKRFGGGSHALLLYGCERASSLEELLDGLPDRGGLDGLVARYFEYQDLVSGEHGQANARRQVTELEIGIVHGPTFVRQLEAFSSDPSSVPIMWIGLLYSMICLAAITSEASGDILGNTKEQQAAQNRMYRKRIVQCLMAGEYTKGGPWVLETLIHYIYVEFALHPDTEKDIWYILGIEVNVAIKSGYHRDPVHFPNLSPFEGEMRRRVWATVMLGDIMVPTQLGMPRLISDWQCDTVEPRNLNDSDLDENMAELPPSRPENRHTTSLGIIARSRLLNVLGTIADLVTKASLPSPAEVTQVDDMLQAARAGIPLPLRFRDIGASIADSPQVIMARLFISVLLNKGYNMIHRRFLFVESPSQTEDLYAHSRRRCLDASLEMLTLLRDLEQEMRPGGVIEVMRWRVMSLLNHQFLTATMILCAVLYYPEMTYRREGIIRALRGTRDLWMRSNSLALSKEAQKASNIVGTALAHVDRPAAPAPAVSSPVDLGGPAAPAPHDTNMGMAPPATPAAMFVEQRPVADLGAIATYDYAQPLAQDPAAAFQADPMVASALAENYGQWYQQDPWYGYQDPTYAFQQQPQQPQQQFPEQFQQPFQQAQQPQAYDPNAAYGAEAYQGGGQQASNWWLSGDPRWSI